MTGSADPMSVEHGSIEVSAAGTAHKQGHAGNGAASRNNHRGDRTSHYSPSSSSRPSPTLLHSSDPNYVADVIPLLSAIFSTRKDLDVYLCNPIQFFYRSKGDGGFGCGYKNIQTLSSALLQFDLYREVLFDGLLSDKKSRSFDNSGGWASSCSAGGQVRQRRFCHCASISRQHGLLARFAHLLCADPSSSHANDLRPAELHRRGTSAWLRCRRRGAGRPAAEFEEWIGAVEAHALLCSYGVRSELVDFKSGHVGLFEYVWNYFSDRTTKVRDRAGQRDGRGPVERVKGSEIDTQCAGISGERRRCILFHRP